VREFEKIKLNRQVKSKTTSSSKLRNRATRGNIWHKKFIKKKFQRKKMGNRVFTETSQIIKTIINWPTRKELNWIEGI